MAIITLTTDYGYKDHFVGALKGKIFSALPTATVVDISHDIEPFNIVHASYILGAAISSFIDGTIHIIGIDSEWSLSNLHVVVLYKNQYFISADNGIISLLIKNEVPEKIVVVPHEDNSETDLEVFVRIARSIADSNSIENIGKEAKELKQIVGIEPFVANDKKSIRGNVIYVDHFGNIVTNISKKIFWDIGNSRKFEIPFRRLLNEKSTKPIDKIWNRYSEIVQLDNFDVKMYEGSKLAVFNEAGFLEIAMYKSNSIVGSAATLLGLGFRDSITINFLD